MKYLLIFLTCLSICSYAQPKLGMSPVYTITPAAATSSAAGVAPNTQIYVQSFVKNKGNATFTGNINVYLALDTSSGPLTPLDTSINNNVTIAPGDSLFVVDSTSTAPVNGFKSGGNGNTIVVWPISASAQTIDSLFRQIFVMNVQGIQELGISPLKAYPNPAGDKLYIKAPSNVMLKTVAVYDLYARKVMEYDFTGVADLSSLVAGTYWIRAMAGDKVYAVMIIKME